MCCLDFPIGSVTLMSKKFDDDSLEAASVFKAKVSFYSLFLPFPVVVLLVLPESLTLSPPQVALCGRQKNFCHRQIWCHIVTREEANQAKGRRRSRSLSIHPSIHLYLAYEGHHLFQYDTARKKSIISLAT